MFVSYDERIYEFVSSSSFHYVHSLVFLFSYRESKRKLNTVVDVQDERKGNNEEKKVKVEPELVEKICES